MNLRTDQSTNHQSSRKPKFLRSSITFPPETRDPNLDPDEVRFSYKCSITTMFILINVLLYFKATTTID